MGYTITIGELHVLADSSVGTDEAGIWLQAVGVNKDEAPAFGEPTDHSNSRWTSYTAWADTMRDVGLYEHMFYDGTLLGGHPGVRLVTPELMNVVSSALTGYREKNPLVPEFGTDTGANLCRLIWLEYWMRWALDNCKVPVIANS